MRCSVCMCVCVCECELIQSLVSALHTTADTSIRVAYWFQWQQQRQHTSAWHGSSARLSLVPRKGVVSTMSERRDDKRLLHGEHIHTHYTVALGKFSQKSLIVGVGRVHVGALQNSFIRRTISKQLSTEKYCIVLGSHWERMRTQTIAIQSGKSAPGTQLRISFHCNGTFFDTELEMICLVAGCRMQYT